MSSKFVNPLLQGFDNLNLLPTPAAPAAPEDADHNDNLDVDEYDDVPRTSIGIFSRVPSPPLLLEHLHANDGAHQHIILNAIHDAAGQGNIDNDTQCFNDLHFNSVPLSHLKQIFNNNNTDTTFNILHTCYMTFVFHLDLHQPHHTLKMKHVDLGFLVNCNVLFVGRARGKDQVFIIMAPNHFIFADKQPKIDDDGNTAPKNTGPLITNMAGSSFQSWMSTATTDYPDIDHNTWTNVCSATNILNGPYHKFTHHNIAKYSRLSRALALEWCWESYTQIELAECKLSSMLRITKSMLCTTADW
ncbi:hypothetical protein FIBSPDRAFT_904100 [Athelia psychrophila]|uniref:DUF8190 domain-containing protein n=1 Tax=Athelia psychrophila TaxID=1759441 RepID=A0A167V5W5_9AGAM|nr:hypothetical protein FIBSPDRAFT_904100 [Fibularhizoctonia sp. CBS 109695]